MRNLVSEVRPRVFDYFALQAFQAVKQSDLFASTSYERQYDYETLVASYVADEKEVCSKAQLFVGSVDYDFLHDSLSLKVKPLYGKLTSVDKPFVVEKGYLILKDVVIDNEKVEEVMSEILQQVYQVMMNNKENIR